MGVDVQLLGPMPTPGVGFLTRNMRADAGIVISASHNPYQDNGIKIFGADGYKVSVEMERAIEKLVHDDQLASYLPESDGVGRSRRIEDAAGRYIVYVKNTFPNYLTLEGLRIVLDCANGAAYKVAPAILEELGAEVMVIGNKPNGTNINDKCGALYPESLSEAVRTYRADIGISLDGDADRVILVDELGEQVNGDHILAICGLYLKKHGRLNDNSIVTTHMANFGLEQLMKQEGIKVIKTDVGDKYVVDEMKRSGYILGGESSGHIIFREHSTTGDGLIAGLSVLAVMREEAKTLSELNSVMKDYPQALRNIRVAKRTTLSELDGYSEICAKAQAELKDQGRIFVRYSGTEPLIRVLVEGPEVALVSRLADELGLFLQKNLGHA
jgi:phosphoglucosamine mutase